MGGVLRLNPKRYELCSRYPLRSPPTAAESDVHRRLGLFARTRHRRQHSHFTLVNAVLLRWLPVQNPQELVVPARNPSRPSTSFNYPDYRYIRDHNRSYFGVIAFSNVGRPTSFSLPGKSGTTQLVALSMVSEVTDGSPTSRRTSI